MIHASPSGLLKLGERTYVQGGTIFNGIVAACDRVFGAGWLADARVASFKLEREAEANGRIFVADEPIAGVDLNATFVADSPRHRIWGGFVDDGEPIQSVPYDEESFNRPIDVGGDLSGTFVLTGGRPREDFMKGIVGANKQVHLRATGFGGALTKVQFLYLKGLDGAFVEPASGDTILRVTNLSVKETDEEVWTINRVDIDRDGLASSFRLCYRARKAR